jgi:hypothetical protein
MSPFQGPRPILETAGGQSALTSGPAPAHRRPTRQRPGRCPSTETSADSTGPAARRSAPTRVELPLPRGQPGTTRRVVPLLSIRWSHDRGKTRLKRSHERGKRQCAAAHAKPSAVPQVEVAPMAATPTGLAPTPRPLPSQHHCHAPCFADRPRQNRNPCPRARRWQPGPGRLPPARSTAISLSLRRLSWSRPTCRTTCGTVALVLRHVPEAAAVASKPQPAAYRVRVRAANADRGLSRGPVVAT